ncbi:hypothetical protein PCASD_01796 [Puccinia coronata f. sp. avenae]|uniref:GCM domain-containing protein n=1 Tax=Puccinia coronata f. sp. avenae TaxID=200324 RepID=A0A2N5VJM3_9BASI|nr:hypothetical protein PCASD_01796 [Puccinia coronata f. sp. avenae]
MTSAKSKASKDLSSRQVSHPGSEEYVGKSEYADSKGQPSLQEDAVAVARASTRQVTGKEWFIPDMDGDHTTCIDHGCTLDKQGYPLYPNGNTTFLRLPEDKVTNFGSVGFTRRCAVNHRGQNKAWKVTGFFCLGVLTCDNKACKWAGSPPTGTGKIEQLSEKKKTCPGLAGKCLGTVAYHSCNTTALRIDLHKTGWGLLRRKGTHEHPWPEAKKPDLIAQEEFAKKIKGNPRAGAFKLKVCLSQS